MKIPSIDEIENQDPYTRANIYAGDGDLWSEESWLSYVRGLFIESEGHVTNKARPYSYHQVPGGKDLKRTWWMDFLTAALQRHGLTYCGPAGEQRLKRASSSVKPGEWRNCVRGAVLGQAFWYQEATGIRLFDEVSAVKESLDNNEYWDLLVEQGIRTGAVDAARGASHALNSLSNKASKRIVKGIEDEVKKLSIDFGTKSSVEQGKKKLSKLIWETYMQYKWQAFGRLETLTRAELVAKCAETDEELGPLFWDEWITAAESYEDNPSPLILLDFRKFRVLPKCICRLAILGHHKCKPALVWLGELGPSEEPGIQAFEKQDIRELNKEWAAELRKERHVDVVMLPGGPGPDYRRTIPEQKNLNFFCPYAAQRGQDDGMISPCDVLHHWPSREWLMQDLEIVDGPNWGRQVDCPRVTDWRDWNSRCVGCMLKDHEHKPATDACYLDRHEGGRSAHIPVTKLQRSAYTNFAFDGFDFQKQGDYLPVQITDDDGFDYVKLVLERQVDRKEDRGERDGEGNTDQLVGSE